MELKERIEKVLSEILSDKYDCNITIRFVPKDAAEKESSLVTVEGGGNLGRSA